METIKAFTWVILVLVLERKVIIRRASSKLYHDYIIIRGGKTLISLRQANKQSAKAID